MCPGGVIISAGSWAVFVFIVAHDMKYEVHEHKTSFFVLLFCEDAEDSFSAAAASIRSHTRNPLKTASLSSMAHTFCTLRLSLVASSPSRYKYIMLTCAERSSVVFLHTFVAVPEQQHEVR